MEEISVQTQTKVACKVCGNPTYITLKIGDTTVSLCQRCLAKLVGEIYNKRDDIISDVLADKKGVSLQDIDEVIQQNDEYEARIAELENIKSAEYDDDEDDEDGDCGW